MVRNPNKYYVKTVSVTDGIFVTKVINAKYQPGYYIKKFGEKGPFSSLASALDICNKRGFAFTADGVKSFMKESLREVKDQLSTTLATLDCYEDV